MVPFLMAVFMIVVATVIERFITLSIANGKGSLPTFVQKIKKYLDGNQVDAAIVECDKQQGSVANIIREGLNKYKQMESNTSLDKEQKMMAIHKEIE